MFQCIRNLKIYLDAIMLKKNPSSIVFYSYFYFTLRVIAGSDHVILVGADVLCILCMDHKYDIAACHQHSSGGRCK